LAVHGASPPPPVRECVCPCLSYPLTLAESTCEREALPRFSFLIFPCALGRNLHEKQLIFILVEMCEDFCWISSEDATMSHGAAKKHEEAVVSQLLAVVGCCNSLGGHGQWPRGADRAHQSALQLHTLPGQFRGEGSTLTSTNLMQKCHVDT